jgi:glucosamine--fructose-6-phosphate aminotransferase (isomerizing)
MSNLFLNEIKSQPAALKDTFDYITKEGKNQFLIIKDFIKKGGINKIIFTGMGSSYISCYLPYYILNQYGIAVEMREAGEFLFNTFPKTKKNCFKDTGIILISQSGESGEIREILRKINSIPLEDKPLTIGITNNLDSYLANMTELQILMNFDKETSVSSKSYVCTLLILYVMSKTIIGEFFNEKEEFQNVENLIKELETFFSNEAEISKIWEKIVNNFDSELKFLEILARGASITTAHQAALNFKEIVKLYSEANSVSSFRHGGIECLNENTHLLLLTSDFENLKLNIKFMENLINKWKFGKLLHVYNQKSNEKLDIIHKNPDIIEYKHNISDPFLALFMEIAVLQLLFYKIAEKRGIEPGVFLFTKKVTDDI